MPFKYPTPIDRLIANSVLDYSGTRVGEIGPCWVWIARVNNVGRPVLSVRVFGKVTKLTVARYIVQYVHGLHWQRKRFYGLHECDNALCSRPDHVRRGTPTQNNRETVERGRHKGFESRA